MVAGTWQEAMSEGGKKQLYWLAPLLGSSSLFIETGALCLLAQIAAEQRFCHGSTALFIPTTSP